MPEKSGLPFVVEEYEDGVLIDSSVMDFAGVPEVTESTPKIPAKVKMRKLTVFEDACKIDFAELSERSEKYVKDTVDELSTAVSNIQTKIVAQVKRLKILTSKDYRKVRNISIDPKAVKDICLNSFMYIYLDGKLSGLQNVQSSLGKKIKFSEAGSLEISKFFDPRYPIIEEACHAIIDRFGLPATMDLAAILDELAKMKVITLAAIGDMKPSESLLLYSKKIPVAKWEFGQMLAREKAQAFTVAGIVEKDLLRQTQSLVFRAIEGGWSLQKFEYGLREAGIKYTGTAYGDAAKRGQPITPIHAETIIRTNFADVYNRGRDLLFDDKAVVEFVPAYQYSAILDSRTRPEHRRMDENVYGRNDPIWTYSRPPNGFNCRCMLIPVTSNHEYIVSKKIRFRPDPGFGDIE